MGTDDSEAGGRGGDEPGNDPSATPVFSMAIVQRPPEPGARAFLCREGCRIEGEDTYLDHAARGHHPAPA